MQLFRDHTQENVDGERPNMQRLRDRVHRKSHATQRDDFSFASRQRP
jgi:hypothetical protein